MRKLNHKNIIHIYQIYEDEKYLNVVEDLLKGGDLLSNLSSYGRFDEVKTQKVMLPIFQALAYLHNTHNIMHRDLKPENVVLRNKSDIFDIVLCDFGLAEYHTKEGNYVSPFLLSRVNFLVAVNAPSATISSLCSERCHFWRLAATGAGALAATGAGALAATIVSEARGLAGWGPTS